MKQNITLRLEISLIQQVRVLAASRSTSISALLSQELTRLVQEADSYKRAKRTALEDLHQGFPLGGRPAERGELHERCRGCTGNPH